MAADGRDPRPHCVSLPQTLQISQCSLPAITEKRQQFWPQIIKKPACGHDEAAEVDQLRPGLGIRKHSVNPLHAATSESQAQCEGLIAAHQATVPPPWGWPWRNLLPASGRWPTRAGSGWSRRCHAAPARRVWAQGRDPDEFGTGYVLAVVSPVHPRIASAVVGGDQQGCLCPGALAFFATVATTSPRNRSALWAESKYKS